MLGNLPTNHNERTQTPPRFQDSRRLDGSPVLRGCEKGIKVKDIKWLANRSRQRVYAWNLKMPHNHVKSKQFHCFTSKQI